MQYERQSDGELKPLPNPSIDTGMGLERIAAVMQGVHNNYDIDLFQHLLAAAAEATATNDRESKSLRVIADHIRSCAFLISDGVMPSNEGRGYVLRRIIRRAVRHGHQLGQEQPFFHKLVTALAEVMGEAYPELRQQEAQIAKVLLLEEEQFAKTLDKGMAVLENALQELSGRELPGDLVFTLYDTYGFPVDLTADIARERGLSLDMAGYEQAMEAQRARARAAGSFKLDYTAAGLDLPATEFLGYTQLAEEGQVLALVKEGQPVEALEEGEDGAVVLDRTPFYAEAGGQVGDTGYLETDEGLRFEVRDCIKEGASHLHLGRLLHGSLRKGDRLYAKVDPKVRQATALNHSATHLMHAALRQLLGEHVTQKGSLVDSERLRFDFSHFEPVKPEQLKAIEDLVNQQIRANTPVQIEHTDMETAKARGAIALFGEKYGDNVRVLSMGDGFSVELCGGTHVARTGDIGLFRITSESGVAAGIRRIEAVTGEGALERFDALEILTDKAAQALKTRREQLPEKAQQLVEQNRKLERELSALKAKLATAGSGNLLDEVQEVAGVKVLAIKLEGADSKSLRESADQLKNKLGSGVVLLATVDGDKVALVAGVTKDLTGKLKAGDLMRQVAARVGGKGGGRPDMAQGGGSDPGGLEQALKAVPGWVEENLR